MRAVSVTVGGSPSWRVGIHDEGPLLTPRTPMDHGSLMGACTVGDGDLGRFDLILGAQ